MCIIRQLPGVSENLIWPRVRKSTRQPSKSISGKGILKLNGKQGKILRKNGMGRRRDIVSEDLGSGVVALAGQGN